MKKIAIALLCLIIVITSIMGFSFKVEAAGPRWVLVDVIDYDGEEQVKATNSGGVYEASSSSNLGNFTYTWKYLRGADSYYSPPLLDGENSTSKASFSVPPTTIQGGENVNLTLNLSFGSQLLSYFSDKASASADFENWDMEPGFTSGSSIPFVNKDNKSSFRIDTYKTVKVYSVSETLTAKTPIATKEGDKIALRTLFNGVKQGTCYIYEWSSTKQPVDIQKYISKDKQSTTPIPDPEKNKLVDSGIKFSDLWGEVSIKRAGAGDDEYEYAELDMVIYVGDVIRVKHGSGMILSMADMSTFKMESEGLLVVNTASGKENKLELLAGNIYTNVKKMLIDGTMEVEMSQAMAGARGTTFVCEETGNKSTLKVLEGTVSFASKSSGKAITVGAGEMAVADSKGEVTKKALNIETEAKAWNMTIIEMIINQKMMKVNGINKEIDPGRETTPVIYNSRTLIPIRAVMESLGGSVGYDANEQKITLKKGQDTLEMWIGKTTIKMNGKTKTIDVAPLIVNERTMVPVRFVAENFGYSVAWKAATQTVVIQ